MKKFTIFFILLLPLLLMGQVYQNFANIYVGSTVPTSCKTPSIFVSALSGVVYTCQSNTYVSIGTGSGGVIAPSSLPDFSTGTSGTDFNIQKNVSDVTFNIPDATATARGFMSTSAQVFDGNKTFLGDVTANSFTSSSAEINVGTETFAELLTQDNGTIVYCSNCDTPASQGAACSSSGDTAGAEAHKIRGAWQCY